ncbi:hypothetical protein BJX99DRAFT_225041 [Aspergillus californicus]
MALNALSRGVSKDLDNTTIGVVDSLRLLRAALDKVEETDGQWHKASEAALNKWDQQ